jgi:hypothetical protein
MGPKREEEPESFVAAKFLKLARSVEAPAAPILPGNVSMDVDGEVSTTDGDLTNAAYGGPCLNGGAVSRDRFIRRYKTAH